MCDRNVTCSHHTYDRVPQKQFINFGIAWTKWSKIVNTLYKV
jgi:hypothetical protein